MFHPDLRLLRSFLAVAAEESVTRAAERLHLTQPTISGQIKELEQAVGFPLFFRTTRNISLSPHGLKFRPFAERVIAEAEALRCHVAAMQTAGKTRFRLGSALYSMNIVDRSELLDDFAMAMPQVSYTIDNRLQSALVPDLLSGRLDAAVLLGVSAPCRDDDREDDITPIYNETQYPDVLERIVLRRQRMNLLVPVSSRFARKDRINKSQLRGMTIAVLNHEHGRAVTDPIEAFLRENEAEIVIPPEGNAFGVERFAERHGTCGIGIGWFPVPAGLWACEVEGMDFYLDFSVVLGTGANSAARQFFDYARQWHAMRAGPQSLSSAA